MQILAQQDLVIKYELRSKCQKLNKPYSCVNPRSRKWEVIPEHVQ